MNLLKNTVWLTLLLLISCNSNSHSDSSDIVSADIRNQINNLTTLPLAEEIESVSYIPLQVTEDDASLIGGILGYAITSKYIYIYPPEEDRVVLFDRKGNFIKTLIKTGQGPGEFNGSFMRMQADEDDNRLYVYASDRIFIYNLEGEFIKTITPGYQYIFNCRISKNRLAAVGFPYMTFKEGNFGVGIFTEDSDPIVTKNDFSSSLVSPDKAGFTLGLTPPAYSSQLKSVLFKTGSNDTIFRVGDDKIQPAFVVNLRNSNNEIIRSLDATDFSTLFDRKFEEDGDIYVSDMFETTKHYYLRFRYNKQYYVASINKKTGNTLAEKCLQPVSLTQQSDANIQFGMIGTKSYNNFPVWGSREGDYLAQIITSYELDLYRENSAITIPEELKIDEESNPIIVLYKIIK